MASIKKRENKSGVVYDITVSQGYDSAGKKIKSCTTYKPDQSLTPKQTEKQVAKFADAFEEKIKSGGNFDGEKTSFEEFALQWLSDKKSSLAYNTYDCYKRHIENYMIPSFKGFKLTEIKIAHVENYYKTLIADLTRPSASRHVSTLKGIFKTAVRLEMIDKNPCDHAVLPKNKNEPETGIKFFTPEQSLIFIRSLDILYPVRLEEHDRKVGKEKKVVHINKTLNTRKVPSLYKVFYHISLFCGLRRCEVLALHWSDIDMVSKTISITQSVTNSETGQQIKAPKTKNSIRVVPIPDNVLTLLKAYRIECNEHRLKVGSYWKGDDSLFTRDDGTVIAIGTPYNFFKAHIKKYNTYIKLNKEKALKDGLTELPLISLHGLRHSTATMLNDIGVGINDISSILGHSRTSITMDIYTHSFQKQSINAVNKINDFVQANAQ